jgi:hypothetical protein
MEYNLKITERQFDVLYYMLSEKYDRLFTLSDKPSSEDTKKELTEIEELIKTLYDSIPER